MYTVVYTVLWRKCFFAIFLYKFIFYF